MINMILHGCVLQIIINQYPDQVFNPLIAAAHQDGRFQANFSGTEFTVGTRHHIYSPVEKNSRQSLKDTKYTIRAAVGDHKG